CAHPVYHSGKTKFGPKPSHPRADRKQTSREDEESDGVEDELRQSKAKALLNGVFELLDLPKVFDWRTMRTMRRNVTRAIEIIKETADEIVSTSASIQSSSMSLTVNETDILIDGIKILFKSSDYQGGKTDFLIS
ncbi:unnamed protein product, partial [Rotaria magnacalcarata]